jgi:hypothetical protein
MLQKLLFSLCSELLVLSLIINCGIILFYILSVSKSLEFCRNVKLFYHYIDYICSQGLKMLLYYLFFLHSPWAPRFVHRTHTTQTGVSWNSITSTDSSTLGGVQTNILPYGIADFVGLCCSNYEVCLLDLIFQHFVPGGDIFALILTSKSQNSCSFIFDFISIHIVTKVIREGFTLMVSHSL